uniref:Uncharacterized protein n=1 Tax=Knipowitschia caucasica TaxID=637954 RepID=A0AAV2J869_KNICA
MPLTQGTGRRAGTGRCKGTGTRPQSQGTGQLARRQDLAAGTGRAPKGPVQLQREQGQLAVDRGPLAGTRRRIQKWNSSAARDKSPAGSKASAKEGHRPAGGNRPPGRDRPHPIEYKARHAGDQAAAGYRPLTETARSKGTGRRCRAQAAAREQGPTARKQAPRQRARPAAGTALANYGTRTAAGTDPLA